MKSLLILPKQKVRLYWNAAKSEYGLQRYQPLGLLYVSSALENHGVNTEFIDQSIEDLSIEELKHKISNNKYDFIGFYSDSTLKDSVVAYIKNIKNSFDIPVIVGGPGVVHSEQFFEAGCDIICNGEGEITVCEIVDYLMGRKKIEEIKGISFRKDGRIIKNEDRDLIQDLDGLSFPDRKKTQVDKYYDFHKFTMRVPFTTVAGSRGCPYNCYYCAAHNFWKRKVRVRTPENIIKEVDKVVDEYKIKYIYFIDDNFGLKKEWLFKFCNLLIEKKYDFHWCCTINPFSFKGYKEEAFRLMKKAGCDHIILGLQSANPEILKNVDRDPQQPKEARETIEIAKRFGYLVQLEMIFGLPGDTEETIKESLDYTISADPHISGFFALTILAGSELERIYGKSNVCGLSKERIDELCSLASRRFYLRPKKIAGLLAFIITRNIGWFIRAAKFLPFILYIVGLRRRMSK